MQWCESIWCPLLFLRSNVDTIKILVYNICELQLEKLQSENAIEWGKREQLETEKLALERENKKLRAEVDHLEEEIERKTRQASAVVDSDIKALQFDLAEKSKVWDEVCLQLVNV